MQQAKSESLFPYERVRAEQDSMLKDVAAAVSSGKCLIAHAPTGLGKTAAVLAPALEFAIQKGKTVFFLTSRHTQHAIAVETLRKIKEKRKAGFSVADVVGKKHMCARDDVSNLRTRQFHEYCKSLTESDGCEFFLNFKKGTMMTQSSKIVIATISSEPLHSEEAVFAAKKHGVCPYEATVAASRDASVIIADYYYLFNSRIREGFLRKSGKTLENSIIIVDEAHNLPDRMREMLTDRISTAVVDRAVKEAEKLQDADSGKFLLSLKSSLMLLGKGGERIVKKEDLTAHLANFKMEKILEQLNIHAETVREAEQQSSIGSVADFLARWEDDDEGSARIASSDDKGVVLSYNCLDPSIEAGKVIRQAHCVIAMSGTLTPTSMYKDILGFPEGTVEKKYASPLPKENRLSLIVPGITTQFTKRNAQQYARIAEACVKAAKSIPGNAILFFPSYNVMEAIHPGIHGRTGKVVFKENHDMGKEEKQRLLQEFREAHKEGGLLLAVIGGNFSEGIDLPGTLLNGVIIVGLPLGQPDLRTKELIRYYEAKYGRGWDYGYIYPAFTKALQSAGRCIRTETDRGVILFLDERYTWDRYYACFPPEMAPKTTMFYEEAIKEFFRKA